METTLRQLGFTDSQLNDVKIIMSLETDEELADWMEKVGVEDVEYGIRLLEVFSAVIKYARKYNNGELDPSLGPARMLMDKYFS